MKEPKMKRPSIKGMKNTSYLGHFAQDKHIQNGHNFSGGFPVGIGGIPGGLVAPVVNPQPARPRDPGFEGNALINLPGGGGSTIVQGRPTATSVRPGATPKSNQAGGLINTLGPMSSGVNRLLNRLRASRTRRSRRGQGGGGVGPGGIF